MREKSLPRLYPILDVDYIGSPDRVFELGQAIIRAGVRLVQVRWKKCSNDRAFFQLVKQLKACSDAIIVVNDRADIALVAGADGVHVGSNDIPPFLLRKTFGNRLIIGYSAHSIDEIEVPEISNSVDYLAFGTIFPTTTKQAGTVVQGITNLKAAVRKAIRPIYAIGGINLSNVQQILDAGAYGIACISAIFGAPDPEKTTRKFLQLVDEN